jgi:hypothetical protein
MLLILSSELLQFSRVWEVLLGAAILQAEYALRGEQFHEKNLANFEYLGAGPAVGSVTGWWTVSMGKMKMISIVQTKMISIRIKQRLRGREGRLNQDYIILTV